jgi:hypothetical protein
LLSGIAWIPLDSGTRSGASSGHNGAVNTWSFASTIPASDQ